MATSPFPTCQYPSTHFTLSAGCIAFHPSQRKILLLHYHPKNEYLLPKGRINISETPAQAAMREVREETSFTCRLLPVKLATRAPPAVEEEEKGGKSKDEVRVYENVTEPFMVTCRFLGEDNKERVKIITWYIAEVDEGVDVGSGEEGFTAELFGFEESVERLTFELDRDVVRRAIEIFEESY